MLNDWVHWEGKVDKLEKQHTNGPRKRVNQGDVTRFDSQYRTARGTGDWKGPDPVLPASKRSVFHLVTDVTVACGESNVMYANKTKPPHYCCGVAQVQASLPLKCHSGAGNSRTLGCSYPHSTPVTWVWDTTGIADRERGKQWANLRLNL